MSIKEKYEIQKQGRYFHLVLEIGNIDSAFREKYDFFSKQYGKLLEDRIKLEEELNSTNIGVTEKAEKLFKEFEKKYGGPYRNKIKAKNKERKRLEKEAKEEQKRLEKYKKSEKYIKDQIVDDKIAYGAFKTINECERNILFMLINKFNINDSEKFILIMKTACPTLEAFSSITDININLENEITKDFYLKTLIRITGFINLEKDQFKKLFNLDSDEVIKLSEDIINSLLK